MRLGLCPQCGSTECDDVCYGAAVRDPGDPSRRWTDDEIREAVLDFVESYPELRDSKGRIGKLHYKRHRDPSRHPGLHTIVKRFGSLAKLIRQIEAERST